MLRPQRRDAIFHVLGHLGADLEPEDQFVGQERGERDEETAEAAADVGVGHLVCQRRDGVTFDGGGGGLGIWRDERRVVWGPVHQGRVCGAGEASI